MPDKSTNDARDAWSQGDRRPVPDPTLLTTQALQREVLAIRELFDARLNAMDKAVSLLQALMDKSPSIAEMYAKHEEKFASIQIQFNERDTRAEQTRTEGKVSIDAALQAAKEAVSEQNKSNGLAIAKSETSTTKQIDQIVQLIASGQKGTDDKIEDIKERVTKIEAAKQGVAETRQGAVSNWGLVFGGVGMFVGVIATIIAIAVFLKH